MQLRSISKYANAVFLHLQSVGVTLRHPKNVGATLFHLQNVGVALSPLQNVGAALLLLRNVGAAPLILRNVGATQVRCFIATSLPPSLMVAPLLLYLQVRRLH